MLLDLIRVALGDECVLTVSEMTFTVLRNQKLNDEDLPFKAYGEGTTCVGAWCGGWVVV